MGKILQLTSGILTGATSVLAFKSYRQYRQDIATADQRVRMDGQTIQTAAGSINFNIRGEGAPVLIIHGMGGGFDQALHVAQLWKDNYRWIAPSRFGYLGSSLPQDALSSSPGGCLCRFVGSP